MLSSPILALTTGSLKGLEGEAMLSGLSILFAKCKDSLEEGRRLQNISWRLWARGARPIDPRAATPLPVGAQADSGNFVQETFDNTLRNKLDLYRGERDLPEERSGVHLRGLGPISLSLASDRETARSMSRSRPPTHPPSRPRGTKSPRVNIRAASPDSRAAPRHLGHVLRTPLPTISPGGTASESLRSESPPAFSSSDEILLTKPVDSGADIGGDESPWVSHSPVRETNGARRSEDLDLFAKQPRHAYSTRKAPQAGLLSATRNMPRTPWTLSDFFKALERTRTPGPATDDLTESVWEEFTTPSPELFFAVHMDPSPLRGVEEWPGSPPRHIFQTSNGSTSVSTFPVSNKTSNSRNSNKSKMNQRFVPPGAAFLR